MNSHSQSEQDFESSASTSSATPPLFEQMYTQFIFARQYFFYKFVLFFLNYVLYWLKIKEKLRCKNLDALEKQADRLFDQQKYPEALDIYLSLAKKYPKAEKYSIYCGNCFDAIGQTDAAIRYYKKASKLNPVSVASLIALSNLYYNNEDYANAAKFAKDALKRDPANASAFIILGNCHYSLKHFESAFAYYEKAYNTNPKNYIALINMANTAYDMAKYVKAVDFASKSLEVYPKSIDAYIILGNSYMELGRQEKAETNLLKALSYKSDNPWIYDSLSRLYQKAEDYENALSFGWKAVLFAGDAQEDQHINFGYLLYECAAEGHEDLAKEYATKWIEAFQNHPLVKYMAGAILENKKLKKADSQYVEKIFDLFAQDFESTLFGLDYMVPLYIAEAVRRYFKKDFYKKTNYLDLGCGTGLCAQNVAPLIGWHNTTGVDLSQKMLDEAAKKDIFDRLIHAEIIQFLKEDAQNYQLVTIADVLTYFGDLRPVFEAIASHLDLGGMMCFSISENTLNAKDYYLTPSGRFVHTIDYILSMLTKCGFSKIGQERKALRNEGDQVVYGYIITAEKVMIVEK